MFKIPFWADVTREIMEGSDKIVIYCNPQNELAERLVERLRSYPQHYFNEAVPLFTHRIRNGVSKSFEPKESNIILRVLRRMTRKEDMVISYGRYMAILIARSIQSELSREGITKKGVPINFNMLTDNQISKIGVRVLVFVLKRCEEDLEVSVI